MFVGEQAKKLREAAGLSYEELSEATKLTVADLKNFENGEIYSIEVIQTIYQMYFQSIDTIYWNQNKSFLEFLETFCKENDLDFDSLQETYFNAVASMILDYHDKEMSQKLLKRYIQNSSILKDSNQYMIQSAKSTMEAAKGYKDAYKDAHQAWHRNADMAEILIDIITTNGLEDMIVEKVMAAREEEREDEFPEHEEESYEELIHTLKTRWDFLEVNK